MPAAGPTGLYHMFLPPGTYDIGFTAPGYVPSTSSLTVTPTSATVMDVPLTPIATEPTPPQNLRIVG